MVSLATPSFALAGQAMATTRATRMPAATSTKWCWRVNNVASQTSQTPTAVTGHHFGKSRNMQVPTDKLN